MVEGKPGPDRGDEDVAHVGKIKTENNAEESPLEAVSGGLSQ